MQIDQDLAWRLFTEGINREDAQHQVQLDGDEIVGSQILVVVSIMA